MQSRTTMSRFDAFNKRAMDDAKRAYEAAKNSEAGRQVAADLNKSKSELKGVASEAVGDVANNAAKQTGNVLSSGVGATSGVIHTTANVTKDLTNAAGSVASTSVNTAGSLASTTIETTAAPFTGSDEFDSSSEYYESYDSYQGGNPTEEKVSSFKCKLILVAIGIIIIIFVMYYFAVEFIEIRAERMHVCGKSR